MNPNQNNRISKRLADQSVSVYTTDSTAVSSVNVKRDNSNNVAPKTIVTIAYRGGSKKYAFQALKSPSYLIGELMDTRSVGRTINEWKTLGIITDKV